MGQDIKRSETRIKGFLDSEMEFQLLRQLGAGSYGGSSIGECFYTSNQIEDGIPESWVSEFSILAAKQESDAQNRLKKNHTISAKGQFLKASNSYRAAEYYTNFDDPKHQELGLKARNCFLEAMKCSEHYFESISISYKNIKLPCYFMSPNSDKKKRKTLLVVSGFDGTTEEEFMQRGYAALERGYNVLLFAGPGQMDTLRFYPETYFEPDFENPVKEVLDYCSTRSEIDMDKLGFMGLSFGGYFALRAASREPRIKSLILNSPILNLHDYLTAFTGFDPVFMPDEDNFSLEDIPHIPSDVMSERDKIMSANLMGRFGQQNFKDTFIYLNEFIVGDEIKNIDIPCLALVGSGEGGEPQKQFDEFCEQAPGKVTKYTFTQDEGADGHCQVGNLSYSAAVYMDWLDECFE